MLLFSQLCRISICFCFLDYTIIWQLSFHALLSSQYLISKIVGLTHLFLKLQQTNSNSRCIRYMTICRMSIAPNISTTGVAKKGASIRCLLHNLPNFVVALLTWEAVMNSIFLQNVKSKMLDVTKSSRNLKKYLCYLFAIRWHFPTYGAQGIVVVLSSIHMK